MRNVTNIVEIKSRNLSKGRSACVQQTQGLVAGGVPRGGEQWVIMPLKCLTINMCSYEIRVSMSNRFYRHTQFTPTLTLILPFSPVATLVFAVKVEMYALRCCCCRKAHYFRLEFSIKMNHWAFAGVGRRVQRVRAKLAVCLCVSVLVYMRAVVTTLIADAHTHTYTYSYITVHSISHSKLKSSMRMCAYVCA